MLSLVDRPVVVRLAPFVALLLARWYDREIMLPAQRSIYASYDLSTYQLVFAVGSVLVAGLVLVLGVLAWRSRSMAVGIGYALLGAVVVLDGFAMVTIAMQVNNAPPAVPQPVADAIANLWDFLYGPLGAAATVAAGLLVAGAAVVVRVAWDRGAASRRDAPEARQPVR